MRPVIFAIALIAAPAMAMADGGCFMDHTASKPQQTVMQDTTKPATTDKKG